MDEGARKEEREREEEERPKRRERLGRAGRRRRRRRLGHEKMGFVLLDVPDNSNRRRRLCDAVTYDGGVNQRDTQGGSSRALSRLART